MALNFLVLKRRFAPICFIARLRSFVSILQAVDVFETSDLPEVDQHLLSSTEAGSNDNVEILPITPNEAFGRFKGKGI